MLGFFEGLIIYWNLLQSMGETVEEEKKGKTKKVKAEKSKLGKKEKRKGSSEQTATATDNIDNEEDETAEDIKLDEEEKKETKVVRNEFVEEDLMSFKQNFYLVNSGIGHLVLFLVG